MQEVGINKFLLACRHFQRGVAALQKVKRDHPMRELLAKKSFIYEHEQGDADARQLFTEGALQSRSREYSTIDMLMTDT